MSRPYSVVDANPDVFTRATFAFFDELVKRQKSTLLHCEADIPLDDTGERAVRCGRPATGEDENGNPACEEHL